MSNLTRTRATLETIAERLEKSPLFHLSLSSKELFHSNFWAWLIDHVDAAATLALFSDRARLKPGEKPRVDREKEHIDLMITGQDFIVAVENKVKDIPHQEQLDRYKAKLEHESVAKPEFILVTLFPPSVNPDGWIVRTYADLAERLNTFSAGTEYQRALISDYAGVMRNLSDLAKALPMDDRYDFFWSSQNKTVLEPLERLRFDDVYKKFRGSQLARFLFERADALFPGKVKFGYLKQGDLSKELQGGNYITVGSSYNNKESTVDVNFFFPNGSSIDVQIERGQYRHFLRARNSEEKAEVIMDSVGYWFRRRGEDELYRGGNQFCSYSKHKKDVYQFEKLQYGISFDELAKRVTDDLSWLIANKDVVAKLIG